MKLEKLIQVVEEEVNQLEQDLELRRTELKMLKEQKTKRDEQNIKC